MADAAKQLEPDAATMIFDAGASDQVIALVSIAISLRRLADTHDGTAAGINIAETIFGGKKP